MGKTRYVVMEEVKIDERKFWAEYSPDVESTSSDGALRVALNGQGNLGTRYVAVPQRSWKPQIVKVETQHRLKIG